MIDRTVSARAMSTSCAAKTVSISEGAVLVSVIGLLSTEERWGWGAAGFVKYSSYRPAAPCLHDTYLPDGYGA